MEKRSWLEARMLVFYLFLYLLVLIFGIALLCVVISWKPQRGKSQFIGFVALTFVAAPVTQLLFWALLFFGDGTWGNRQTVEMMVGVNIGALMMMFTNMLILLMLYAVSRLPGDQSLESNGIVESLTVGKVWETRGSPQESIQTLRRREWAFLIDIMPVVLMCVAVLGLSAWSSQYSSGYRPGRWALIAARGMSLTLPFLFFYIIFRDSIGGVSIGKRITGCRVVNANTGQSAKFGSCLIRNLIFLIPLLAIVELAVASFRNDRRRLGDLLAFTMVVAGSPKTIDGIEQPTMSELDPAKHPAIKHALDD